MSTRRFAEGTKVDEFTSRHQIETLLFKRGASDVATRSNAEKVEIMFAYEGLVYRVSLVMTCDVAEAKKEAYKVAVRSGGGRRHFDDSEAIQKERDRRMRALHAVIKAKLIAVDEGITDFVTEFLPHVQTPSGETIGERIIPELNASAIAGTFPKALPWGGSK